MNLQNLFICSNTQMVNPRFQNENPCPNRESRLFIFWIHVRMINPQLKCKTCGSIRSGPDSRFTGFFHSPRKQSCSHSPCICPGQQLFTWITSKQNYSQTCFDTCKDILLKNTPLNLDVDDFPAELRHLSSRFMNDFGQGDIWWWWALVWP